MRYQVAGALLLALGCVVQPGSSVAECESGQPCASAAVVPCETTTYRIVYETVYDEREVTAYRTEYDTVYDEREVTVMRPVYETEVRQRRYTVAKPVCETSEREERYTVLKPVYETVMRDASYDRVRTVCETAEREERYQVAKPVWETSEREERFVVRKPVIETAEREESHTVMEPVTTYRPVQVDRGGYVCQQVMRPGPTITRLRWHSAQCVLDPATGQTTYQRAGLYWTPFTAPAQVEVQRVWQPNVVEEQVAQTSYVPRVETRRVPYQVQRFVDEEHVRRVPVQTCRMQMEEHVRRVPYTVQRQVVERVEQQVPVQVCRYEQQEIVRKVPVTVQRTHYEERVEETPVQVCRYQPTVQTQRTPRTVARKVPVTYTCRVPRLVVHRIPVDQCAPLFGDLPASDVTGTAVPAADAGQPATTYYTPPPAKNEPTPAAKPAKPQKADSGEQEKFGPVDEDSKPSSTYERDKDENTTRPLRRLPRF